MKSMFQMGTVRRDLFMGQALPTDANALAASLNDAMKKYSAVAAFAAKPDYRKLLGADAQRFDLMKDEVDSIYAEVIASQQYLNSSATTISLTDTQGQNVQDFINLVGELYKIVQKAGLPSPSSAAAAAGPSSNTMLLVGGGIAAGLVVLAIALKKG